MFILLLGAAWRLPALHRVPPGWHQDEAVNAWNAYCLLRTGRDQTGAPWPLFYMRALGGYRSVLFAYLLVPFQAVGGMNAWTSRLPAAVSGLVTIASLYWVGARLFGRGTGLAAAGLLAINPIHIQMSRYGNETSVTPLLTLLPFAAWVWAGLPPAANDGRLSVVRTVFAGLVTGLCCYGYGAVRLFVPICMTVWTLVTWSAWRSVLRRPGGTPAVVGLAIGIGVTLGPLAYKHVTEPHIIGRRAQQTWIWKPGDPLHIRVAKVAHRYGQHFDPRYLFVESDADEAVWAAPLGLLPWYVLPGMLVGLACLLPRVKQTGAVPQGKLGVGDQSRDRKGAAFCNAETATRSPTVAPRSGCVFPWHHTPAARVLLVGVLLYPVADAFNWHISLHNQRAAAGLWLLILLAGVGLGAVVELLWRQRLRVSTLAIGTAWVGLAVPEQLRFARFYFGDRAQKTTVYYGTHQDLLAACDWLRPRLAEADAVLCFADGPVLGYTPWVVTLVHLQHDPQQWFNEPRILDESRAWDRYVRYGRFWFLYPQERQDWLAEAATSPQRRRVLLLLRPDESAPCPPTEVIRDPAGRPAVILCDCLLGGEDE